MPKLQRALSALVVVSFLAGCGGDDDPKASGCGDDCPVDGTQAVLHLEADLDDSAQFFDVPYPNDLRLDAEGHPQLTGFPNLNELLLVQGLVDNAKQARGFPVIPVAFLRFTAELGALSKSDVIPAQATSPLLLIDVDPDSPERGALIPVVAETLPTDLYVPENMIAVAPRPGFVLRAGNRYGVVARRSLLDSAGEQLVQSPRVRRLAQRKPKGDLEAAADAVYAPLWETLDQLGVPREDVASATVFSTGDVVQELAALSDGLVARHDVTIDGLTLVDDPEVPELCILSGTVSYPQFQRGTPPFDTEGGFEIAADGLPVEQRQETAPIKIVLPKTEMPAAGYPLVLNIHGSGGYSIAMVRPVGASGPGAPIGPALPYGHRGLAMAGSAMPVNPERLPGASEIAYLNPTNLAAMRDTFRQGIIELRLFLEALTKLTIDPTLLSACSGASLPASATAFKFDPDKLLVTGQSMGGMYTNMLAAIEPQLKAAVPTGAGGHWTHFIFLTPLNGGTFPGLLNLAVSTPGTLSFVHPVVAIGAAALEAADPVVFVSRIARRPLAGHPVRSILQPSAPEDSYFDTETYDALALAFGHPQAGPSLWPEMQQALALAGLDGELTLPLQDNLTSESGTPYTGAVMQYEPVAIPGDAFADGHAIYTRRDDLKYQYGCFLHSWVTTGKAKIPALKNDWKAPCE